MKKLHGSTDTACMPKGRFDRSHLKSRWREWREGPPSGQPPTQSNCTSSHRLRDSLFSPSLGRNPKFQRINFQNPREKSVFFYTCASKMCSFAEFSGKPTSVLQKMDEIDKLLLDARNFIHDSIDLQCMPLEDVFEQLRTSGAGLSSADAEARLQLFGLNKLEEKSENKFLKFLSFMWNPLTWVMEAAAVMAIVLANGGCQGPYWQDFAGIICLLIINSTISFLEENNAGNAAAALTARLAPKCKVLRDAQWQEKDASVLVPGDIISIKLGDIIPADARLLEGDPLKVDQSALTGESFPVTKMRGDLVFSGSICKQGEVEAVVIATSIHFFFGKAALLVDSTEVVGHFQKVLTSIGNFCICSIAVGIILEIVVMFLIQHHLYRNRINNLLVLLIGGIQ